VPAGANQESWFAILIMSEIGVFHCVVMTPKAKVLECKTPSVILPAHDGQVGIWRNHMPMLVELGLGLMEVKGSDEEGQEHKDCTLLVDGGFARISQNVLTILTYEATAPEDVTKAKAEQMLAKAQSLPETDPESLKHKQHQVRRATLAMQMAK
jgi:F-type H+-transporting ATPase subunit epsilon